MRGNRRLLLFCLIGLMAWGACNARPQDAPEIETTLTLFPVQEENEGEKENGTEDKPVETVPEEKGTPTTIPEPTPTVTPKPTPTPRLSLPEDIVDTSKEPYTYEEMCEDLGWLSYAYPDRLSYKMAGQSADGRDIPVVLFGNPEAEQTVFVQAAIHGREHLTALLVMEQLEYYAKNYDTESYEGMTYRDIFSKVCLLVVPMSNPDGVTISQIGTESIRSEELRSLVESFYERDGAGVTRDYFYRRYKANAKGVDLNRNFAYGWEEFGGAKAPAADRYKGTAPGSEPETQILMELTQSRDTAVALSYHATGSVLYWDFGQTGSFREKCLSFVKTVNGLTGYRIVYAASEKQDEAGYCEWAAGICGIPEVTIEIGTVAAPLPITEFAGVWKRNKEVPVAVAYQVLEDREESRE